jgi:hypothetical protein
MEPLDLESRPPRGPREKLAGMYFLPRTIDKMRAELPGGKPGAYIVTGESSMSAYVLHKLRIDVDELRAVVARAADEDEVEAWLRERIDPAAIEPLNEKLENARIDATPPDKLGMLNARYPILATRSDIVDAFGLLEADDAHTFASR